MEKIKRILIHYIPAFFAMIFCSFFIPGESLCKQPAGPAFLPEKQFQGKYLSVKLHKEMSAYELITSSGYSIDDRDVVSFLTDFSSLNEGFKSLSVLRKGSVIKLPLKNLKKTGSTLLNSMEKSELHAIKKKIISRKQKEVTDTEIRMHYKSIILRNVQHLSQAIDNAVSIDADGFKFFAIDERSEMVFDTSIFPIINLNKDRIVVLDYTGAFPSEMKDLIEITWPEYRIVSNKGPLDLKSIITQLLDSMGYSVSNDGKIIIGGKTKLEYLSDFIAYKKTDDILNSDFLIIGIIAAHEYATPEEVLTWMQKKGLHVVELSNNETKRYYKRGGNLLHISPDASSREFIESALSLLGYAFSRDTKLNISDKKEFSYNLRADLSIALGKRTKIIEFIELSDYEIQYARQRGFDIACIGTRDEKREIINKIMSLLSLNYKNKPEMNSAYITPKGVKYRLLSPGVFVHSIKGPKFLTDTDLDPELMRNLMDYEVDLITF